MFNLLKSELNILDAAGEVLPDSSSMDLYIFPFLRAMTDEALYPNLLGLVSASQLKYRERDAMDAVCRTWFTLTAGQYDPSLSWLDRLHVLV